MAGLADVSIRPQAPVTGEGTVKASPSASQALRLLILGQTGSRSPRPVSCAHSPCRGSTQCRNYQNACLRGQAGSSLPWCLQKTAPAQKQSCAGYPSKAAPAPGLAQSAMHTAPKGAAGSVPGFQPHAGVAAQLGQAGNGLLLCPSAVPHSPSQHS